MQPALTAPEPTTKPKRRRFSSKSRRRKKLRLARRDGLLCTICFKPAASVDELSLDHILPLSQGGEDRPWNWALACHDCNQRKGSGTVDRQRAFVSLMLADYGNGIVNRIHVSRCHNANAVLANMRLQRLQPLDERFPGHPLDFLHNSHILSVRW
jgi:hypothetical protein